MKTSKQQKRETQRARRRLIEGANRTLVEAALREVVGRLPSELWLHAGSGFAFDASSELRNNTPADLSARVDEVAEYAAASAVLHCADAWNYLGRAVNAVSAGLINEAVHLSYYSEVRAGLSLLMSSGIVLHPRGSVVIDSSGGVQSLLEGSTHQILWRLLDEWAASPNGVHVLGSAVRFRGASLTEWLDARTGGALSGAPEVSSLMQIWGIDLSTYERDSARRNIASYQPSQLLFPDLAGYAEWARSMLVEICATIEPQGPGSFPRLDAELVAHAIAALAEQQGATDLENYTEEQLSRTAKRVFAIESVAGDAVAALTQARSRETSLVVSAMTSRTPEYPVTRSDVAGMLGRATILARLATGSVRQLQFGAGVLFGDMAPWADRTGRLLGYWDPQPRPDPLTDMWLDLAEAKDELESLVLGAVDGTGQLHRLASEHLLTVTGLSRAALWSLSG